MDNSGEHPTREQKVSGPTSRIKDGLYRAVESVFPSVRYKNLIVKEYAGNLNQKEFNELLDFDLREYVRDTPPIKGIFLPDVELTRIRSLPKDQKKEALGKFKEKFAIQKEALANCRVFIERSIEFDHDVPREKLIGLVEQFGKRYGFNHGQKMISEQLIDGYYLARQRVLEIRKSHPDNTDLVNELTGVGFDKTAQFDVSTGAMSVDIITDGFNASRIYQNSKDVVQALTSNGFASQSTHEQPIAYIVLNKDEPGESTLPHEREHVKNMLFRKIFDKQTQWSYTKSMFAQYELEQDPETKGVLLELCFRLERQVAFNEAKDEIIAMKKDRGNYRYDIAFKKREGSTYDYLAYLREWEVKKHDSLWQDMAQKVLVDEYGKTIERAVESFDDLEVKGEYTREEAIAMFADKSLADWPKTARRQLEQQEKGRTKSWVKTISSIRRALQPGRKK